MEQGDIIFRHQYANKTKPIIGNQLIKKFTEQCRQKL